VITPAERLVAFVVANLPDSLSERAVLLRDSLHVLPDGPTRERVETMLTYLESHQRQQLEFAVIITTQPPQLPETAKATAHSKRGRKKP
jgi:hypothetical protein